MTLAAAAWDVFIKSDLTALPGGALTSDAASFQTKMFLTSPVTGKVTREAVDLRVLVAPTEIYSQIMTASGGGIVFGVKEDPLTLEAATAAATRLVGVLTSDRLLSANEVSALEDELNRHRAEDVQIALQELDRHPLRGPHLSTRLDGDAGLVNAKTVPGVKLGAVGSEARFMVTTVSGSAFTTDVLTMPAVGLVGFGRALLAVLES